MGWSRGFSIARAASDYATAPRKSRRIGAALFAGSTLIAIGFNRYGYSHPDAKWGIHAEHAALIKRRWHPGSNLIMYVYRENANGKPALCKPCLNCERLMVEAGVRFVRFTDSDGNFKQLQI